MPSANWFRDAYVTAGVAAFILGVELDFLVHLNDVLYLLFSQDISGRVARVDDGNTSNLRAISAGSRERCAQVFHLTRQNDPECHCNGTKFEW